MKKINFTTNELFPDLQAKIDAFYQASSDQHVDIKENFEFSKHLRNAFAFSNFISENCINNPVVLSKLLTDGDLYKKYKKGEYRIKLSAILKKVDNFDQLFSALRAFRTCEMIRIAWRDINDLDDLLETMNNLSCLADAAINETLALLFKWQCDDFGTPLDKNKQEQYLIVIGMGKLGAGELNFSSDIDLIFAYPQSGYTSGQKNISNEEFFIRLCRSLIRVLGENSSEGFVFRVDARLRPYGENGPIVMTFDAMEEYYQLYGRDWERYAWIKARVITDKNSAGKNFLNVLKPFVFRRYLDFGAFDSIRDMKQMINMEQKKKNLENNIKTGYGGIREIEFFGQVFQLIRGGVSPILQKRPILEILKILVKEKYIEPYVGEQLSEAYIFLRITENRLQEYSDLQTHELSTEPAAMMRLSASMGFESWNSFYYQLNTHRKNVSTHFGYLLSPQRSDPPGPADKAPEFYKLEGVWHGILDYKRSREILLNINYENPDEVITLIDSLRNDPTTKALSADGRKRLDKLMPFVLEKSGCSEQPFVSLKRIIELIKTIRKRSCYIALLIENTDILSHLVKLSSASPWIISFLSKHPVLLDEFIDHRSLYVPPKKDELIKDLNRRFSYVSDDDLERQIEELCIFKQINILRAAAADISGSHPLMKVSDHLTYIAEVILSKVFELAWNYLVKKHGRPLSVINEKKCDIGFTVVAYGKLGGFELGYSSDLDLVFLHSAVNGKTDSLSAPIENVYFFSRLGQRIIHILTAHTSAGVLYQTDMRLRPNGISGPLVSHIESFENYQTSNAWTWEHQAVIRARPIVGDIDLAESFNNIRRKVICIPRNRISLKNEIVKMRERRRKKLLSSKPGLFDLKQDIGGIVDIEFMVQYHVLLNSNKHPSLTKWTDNVRLLQALTDAGIITENTGRFLNDAYLSYRASVHRLNLQENPSAVPEKNFREIRNRVIETWNITFSN